MLGHCVATVADIDKWRFDFRVTPGSEFAHLPERRL
jgi:hypothetical protein